MKCRWWQRHKWRVVKGAPSHYSRSPVGSSFGRTEECEVCGRRRTRFEFVEDMR